jgi:3'(2'), 5'-bisphosphate nucleotidase
LDDLAGAVARDAALYDALTALASRAAAIIVAIGPDQIRVKPDGSPVTRADEAAEALILEGLARLLPGVPVASEETRACRTQAPAAAMLLVDPLDGTRDFVAGRPEYAVNIALLSGATPVVGIVAGPALGCVWRGIVGKGAEKLKLAPAPIACRRAVRGQLAAAISRSHLDPASAALLDRLGVAERLRAGSAIKFGWIAEGKVDLYPRLSTTCEWDIAAGHAVLAAAGGVVLTPDGGPLRYGTDPAHYVPGFVAWGDPALAAAPAGD